MIGIDKQVLLFFIILYLKWISLLLQKWLNVILFKDLVDIYWSTNLDKPFVSPFQMFSEPKGLSENISGNIH
jgi:hypothetical protein